VISWLVAHGQFGNERYDTNIYRDPVRWIVNGRVQTKSRSDLANDEVGFRNAFPVIEYKLYPIGAMMSLGLCQMSMRIDGHKIRKNGKVEDTSVSVTYAIQPDAVDSLILEERIDVLSHN
jgi:hypothetical protein